VFRVATTALTLLLMLACAELSIRRIEGLPLLALRLPPAELKAPVSSPRDTAADRYLPMIPLAKGVEPAWYRHNPPTRPDIPMTPAIARRFERYKSVDVYGAFFAWNREYLSHEICQGSTAGAIGLLDDFYVFDPPAPTWYPTFRHLSNIRPPSWFPTNRFGWRGPDVALNKPPETIRIAFVGSSMTVDPYGQPFSHIEFIGEWLSQWMAARNLPYRIEVINAARTGIDTMSVAAIVEQEVAPLEPDLVIYDGANDFGPRMQLELAAQRLTAPRVAAATPGRFDKRSALLRRLHRAVGRLVRGDGGEPQKPSVTVQWPADIDEQHPDVTHAPLPMKLSVVLGQFDAMRAVTEASGGQFAVSSPVRMVRNRLKLTLPDDEVLYNFLNSYYPLTYAQVERLSDFHRRVFRGYAERHGLLYLNSSAQYPLDPMLFADAVHMTSAGRRLKAWIDLQLLIPWIDREIEKRRLPRPMQHPKTVHPAFASTDYTLASRAEILGSCH